MIIVEIQDLQKLSNQIPLAHDLSRLGIEPYDWVYSLDFEFPETFGELSLGAR